MKNNFKILVVVLSIIILGICGFIIYDKVIKDNSTEIKYKYTMNIYKDKYGLCYEHKDYCNEIAYSLKTETNDAKIISINDKYILYNDKTLKFYNTDTKEIKLINLNDEYEKYTILNENYLSFVKENNLYLYNINNKSKEISVNLNEAYYPIFELYTYNNKNVFISFAMLPDANYPGDIIKIFDDDKKEIIDGKDIKNLVIYKEYIYYYKNNLVKKYDLDGNIIDTIQVDMFKNFYYDNIVYIKNNELILENINNKKIIKVADASNSDIKVDTYYYDIDNSKTLYNYQYNIEAAGLCRSDKKEDASDKMKNGIIVSSISDKYYTAYDIDNNFEITNYKLKKMPICLVG